ncbi:MAG: amidohydrolase [Rikenellaceae bacterium]
MSNKILYNAKILTMLSPEIVECGAVIIEGDRIAKIITNQEDAKSYISQTPDVEAPDVEAPDVEAIDCQGRLIMPGLINTHTHASMTLMRNLYEDMDLMTWLNDHVWKFEALQNDDDIEAGARLSIGEMLLGGTTTFIDMYFSMARVARAAKDMGMRALLTETVIVGREEIFSKNLKELVDEVEGCNLVSAGVAPHAPYTVPPATAQVAINEANRYSLPINTHLWEAPSEEAIIRDSYGATPAEYFDDCKLLKGDTILAHCVHLTPEAIDLIKSRGCSVAHCPESNMKLASGIAPLVAMYRAGVNCTIATDGVCSNNDLDMWGEMRTASLLQRVATMDPIAIPAYEILKMATVNGAKAIGMEGKLGVIKEGAIADIIVVDTSKPHHRPNHNLISSLIFCAKGSDVALTMVGGNIVARDGQLTNHDMKSICDDVEQRSQAIISRLSCC